MPMTYESLVTQIQVYCNRTDAKFLGQIPNFIDQAMEHIYLDNKNLGFQQELSSRLNEFAARVNNPVISLPINWLETISVQIQALDGGNNPTGPLITLIPQEYQYIKMIYPDVTATGVPKYYAITNSALNPNPNGVMAIFLGPTPIANYQTIITILARPPFGVGANNTNYITLRHSRLGLYASLTEAQPFLKDDERIPGLEGLYKNASDLLKKDKNARYTDKTVKTDKS